MRTEQSKILSKSSTYDSLGLRKHYLIDNIERLVLKYVFDDGDGVGDLRILGDDWEANLNSYCSDKYYEGEFLDAWRT